MKAKNLLSLLLAITVIIALFAGCAAKDTRADYNSGGEAAVAPGAADNSSTVVSPAVPDRKLIRSVSMDLQTQDMDALLSDINEKITQLEGYTETSEIQNDNSNGAARCASLTIRIPAENLKDFTNHVSSVSNVMATSETAEDVTLNYVAVESRKKALLAEEARLLTLIEKAANLNELLQLEKRLGEIRSELESIISQLNSYDNLIEYATVQLEIDEVKEYTPTEKPSFWQRIGKGFVNSLRNTGNILLEIVIFLVCALPYLLPVAAACGIAVLIIKLTGRKKKSAPKDEK